MRTTVEPEKGEIRLWWPTKVPLSFKDTFLLFVTAQIKRLVQGYARYDPPDSSKFYMNRLASELHAYRKTGNGEHLLNIANYAFLEALEPQHVKFHWDNEAESATRGKI